MAHFEYFLVIFGTPMFDVGYFGISGGLAAVALGPLCWLDGNSGGFVRLGKAPLGFQIPLYPNKFCDGPWCSNCLSLPFHRLMVVDPDNLIAPLAFGGREIHYSWVFRIF